MVTELLGFSSTYIFYRIIFFGHHGQHHTYMQFQDAASETFVVKMLNKTGDNMDRLVGYSGGRYLCLLYFSFRIALYLLSDNKRFNSLIKVLNFNIFDSFNSKQFFQIV